MISPEEYGDRLADVYDDWYDAKMPSDETADFLYSLAPNGTFLELGVGTGRIAARLALRGGDVTGVDVSVRMMDKLAGRPGGDLVKTFKMSMVDVDGLGQFSVVYAVFHSILALETFDEQCAAFRAAAAVLERDGLVVMEVHVPSHRSLADSGVPRLVRMGADWVLLEASRLDEAAQRLDIQLIELRSPGSIQMFPASIRYMTHGELERAADDAGLELERRLMDWTGRLGNGEIYIFKRK